VGSVHQHLLLRKLNRVELACWKTEKWLALVRAWINVDAVERSLRTTTVVKMVMSNSVLMRSVMWW
jgi:hypothetical protein